MKNILVTGGAGYLGSILVPMLLRGNTVTVIDNFMYGQQSLLDVIADEKLTVKNENFRPKETSLKEYDIIIHLACLTGAPTCDRNYWLAHETNYSMVLDLLNLKSKHTKLIYPCTNSGYGVGQDALECDETTPLNPISHYGKLKVSAEAHVLQSGGVSLRFATLFGCSPRMRLDLLVNDFVFRAFNDGFLVLFEEHFKRNYIHVSDAARSIMSACLHYGEMQGQAYNVGLSDANLSKRELAEKIKYHLPGTQIISAPVGEDVDKRNYIVSNAKIEALGFTPRVTLDDGIKELIKGYQIIKRNQFANV